MDGENSRRNVDASRDKEGNDTPRIPGTPGRSLQDLVCRGRSSSAHTCSIQSEAVHHHHIGHTAVGKTEIREETAGGNWLRTRPAPLDLAPPFAASLLDTIRVVNIK